MNKILTILLLSVFALSANSQEDTELYESDIEEPTKAELDHTSEIGLDIQFHASSVGGTLGAGIKYGYMLNPNVVVGPSIRLQRSWYNFQGINSSWNIYGGGAFAHYRLYNYFFVGGEFELLSTPFVQNTATVGFQRNWVPTFLIGGGFSRQFNESFRLNGGIMYDIFDNPNSPFRQAYFMRKENGALIPVIYRIAFFFVI